MRSEGYFIIFIYLLQLGCYPVAVVFMSIKNPEVTCTAVNAIFSMFYVVVVLFGMYA